jgi:hypothetical protein
MLRDYAYTNNWELVELAIARFISIPRDLKLVGFGEITPDSFIWKLYDIDTKRFFYLYAEDYVPNLDHVRNILRKLAPDGAALDLLPIRQNKAFEDSSPNLFANIYKPPTDEYYFSYYAAESGYDFVFLAVSDEELTP